MQTKNQNQAGARTQKIKDGTMVTATCHAGYQSGKAYRGRYFRAGNGLFDVIVSNGTVERLSHSTCDVSVLPQADPKPEDEENIEDAGPGGTRIANKLREEEEDRLDEQFGEPR